MTSPCPTVPCDRPELKHLFKHSLPVINNPPVRSSAVKTYHECTRRWFYEYGLGLVPLGYWSPGMRQGTLFHKAMEWLSKGMSTEQIHNHLHEYQNSVALRLMAAQTPDGRLPDGTFTETRLDQLEVMTHKAAAMAEYIRARDALPKDIIPLAVEKHTACVLSTPSGRSVTLAGRIDVLGQSANDSNEIWLLDYKTTGESPSLAARALEFDAQIHQHRLLAMAAFPDKHVMGSYHLLVKPAGIKYCPKTKDKGGIQSYFTRVLEWYAQRELEGQAVPEKAPIATSKITYTASVPEPDILDRIIEVSHQPRMHGTNGHEDIRRMFPRVANRYVCGGIAGRKACPFLKMCNTEAPHEWAALIREEGMQHAALYERCDPWVKARGGDDSGDSDEPESIDGE